MSYYESYFKEAIDKSLGKTVQNVVFVENNGEGDSLIIVFTDDSQLTINASEYLSDATFEET